MSSATAPTARPAARAATPTSAPGSKPAAGRGPAAQQGFTLLELLVVVTLVALMGGLVALSLPDGRASALDRDAERLALLFEAARVEARSAGGAVWWEPLPGERSAGGAAFRFQGLNAPHWPARWLDRQTEARVEGARAVVLGPEPILPPQRVRLSQGDRARWVVSDGLSPFRVVDEPGLPAQP